MDSSEYIERPNFFEIVLASKSVHPSEQHMSGKVGEIATEDDFCQADAVPVRSREPTRFV
jgi:hypothetical protein